MAKIRTLSKLQEALDDEMSWRTKEISEFKILAKSQSATSRTLSRAGVALLYAHWEGFIKASSVAYLDFVSNQSYAYRDLKTCFAVLGLKSKLAALGSTRKAKPSIDAFDFIIHEIEKPAKLSSKGAFDTEGNLTSSVFTNIAQSLDISISDYETKFNLIDERLVSRRNKVAHGEYLDLSVEEFLQLVDEILIMMRAYKNDIENAATLKNYRRAVLDGEAGTEVAV